MLIVCTLRCLMCELSRFSEWCGFNSCCLMCEPSRFGFGIDAVVLAVSYMAIKTNW